MWILLVPGILSILIFAGAGFVVVAANGGDVGLLEAKLPDAIPYALLVLQVTLIGLVAWLMRRRKLGFRDLGWRMPANSGQILLGVVLGATTALAYKFGLSEVLQWLQRHAGDIVPPGAIVPSLGTQMTDFAFVNVVLAPAVEESFYRGLGVLPLLSRRSPFQVVAWTSFCFGFLHIGGGFWYVLLVGLVVGVPTAMLTAQSRSLFPALALHLTLNVLEVLFMA